MKTKLGVLIFVFMTGMILGAAQPALLYAGGGQTGGGNLWDPFVDTSNFNGTKLFGTLSIYYDVTCVPHPTKAKDPACYPCCPCDQGTATMFYIVRLTFNKTLYTYEGATDGVCLGNIGTPGSGGQGDVIMSFLGTAVTQIFGPGHQWRFKSVDNPGISQDSFAFLADFQIAVQ